MASDAERAALGEVVRKFLDSKDIRTVFDGKNAHAIVDIDAESTVRKAYDILVQDHLSSLPVYNRNGSGQKEYVGIINMQDVLVNTLVQPPVSKYLRSSVGSIEIASEELKVASMDFLDRPVTDLLSLSDEGAILWQYDADEPILKLVEAFGKGVHRALVSFPANGTPAVQLVSQTDLIRYVLAYADLLKDILSINVEPVMTPKPYTVKASETALEGFRVMQTKDVPALGVVDEDGKLIGNLSASDMRGLTQHGLASLAMPIMQYVAYVHDAPVAPPFTCSPSDSLQAVMERLLHVNVHRLWVVDAEQHPLGILTMSDLINVFSPFSMAFSRLFDS